MINRAFLKWAGGKARLACTINEILPRGNRLVEPFCGAGSIFLNSDFNEYLLCDINSDLINLFNIVKKEPIKYILEAKKLFNLDSNNENFFYSVRDEFNQSNDNFKRAIFFLYLNRFCYNGLCRYNKSGDFNVPFGSYKTIYFPEKEILFFSEKAQKATFLNLNYQDCFLNIKDGDVIYCDPPYAPIEGKLSKSFSSYHSSGFSLDDQKNLANIAKECTLNLKIPVIISNHSTEFTRNLYEGALIKEISVPRYISSKERNPSNELIALFK